MYKTQYIPTHDTSDAILKENGQVVQCIDVAVRCSTAIQLSRLGFVARSSQTSLVADPEKIHGTDILGHQQTQADTLTVFITRVMLCSSVRLSVTSHSGTKTAEHRIAKAMQHDSLWSSQLYSDEHHLSLMAPSDECLRSKGRMVHSIRGQTCGWQVKRRDPSNTCHSERIRGGLRRCATKIDVYFTTLLYTICSNRLHLTMPCRAHRQDINP